VTARTFPGPAKGRLTRDALLELIRSGEVETVIAAVPDLYGRLMGKRFTGRFFADTVSDHGWHACDYLLACDMEMDPVPGYRFTSWESGYGDMKAVPDWDTLRRAAWLPSTAIVLCDLTRDDGRPLDVAPRRLLYCQSERALKMGIVLKGGSELELYLFKETYDSARDKSYHGLRTHGSYIEDYHLLQGTKEEPVIGAIVRALDASGVPMESSKGEWGPGQQELNLRYCEVLEQADRNVLAKHAAKEVAYEKGASVTFMAKWDEKYAGNGLHQHISAWDRDGKALFAGDQEIGPVKGSELFRFFLGGVLAHGAELALLYAPNVNSYKRYQSGSFAPTGIAWSYDNRTAGFRVVGQGPSLRIECRLPGGDANPYLAYAAVLAAGLAGVERRIEPPPIFQGDVYAAQKLQKVPGTLREAIALFEKSELARQAFGDDVVEHYLHFARTEQRKFDQVVTCWERERFFERG